MEKRTRLQNIIANMSPKERREFLSDSLYSGAMNAWRNCQGYTLECETDRLLNETKSAEFQNELNELKRLNGNPIYDLGCGSASGLSKVFRTYMPNSKLIGVDIDSQNKQVRKEILAKWDNLQDIARELDHEQYKRLLSETESTILMMFNPESILDLPKYRETFELDEFIEGDFNELSVPDNSAGVVFTFLVGPSDIIRGTNRAGVYFNLENEVKRILIPGGIWITSRGGVYHKSIEILYKKVDSDKRQIVKDLDWF